MQCETLVEQSILKRSAFRVFFSGFFGMCCTTLLLAALCAFAHLDTFTHGCQLPSEWRPLSEGCRAELAEIIVYARVLAIHREPPGGGEGSVHNSLAFGYGYGYEGAEEGLLYSAEVELLCDQAWGSMLEVPTGSRLNLTGLGYLSCQSHTVMENYSYFFFLRMDENYNFLPHGVNFQDAIFSDTADNRRMFSSLFQFSNCTMGNQPFHTFSPEWDTQEDNRLLCSSVQSALFDEEERGRKLRERLAAVERRNRQLKERVRKAKRSLRNARKATRRAEQAAQELQEQLKAAERREGHHLNAITQEEPPPGRYASAALRQQVQL
ncbi:coiled-coil domain-containing protein 3a isoform X2 [Scophthalmus maximus]|uniref:coiled-coil domain-containing protein 3a isoform X2 n=1 Tax=Scophthalmus maximus TaxID=52904 RepID=UPI0015E0E10C|nr:coiled-coil domain-containing protein 3a isoform X2 [Scophthalmus maximus]